MNHIVQHGIHELHTDCPVCDSILGTNSLHNTTRTLATFNNDANSSKERLLAKSKVVLHGMIGD